MSGGAGWLRIYLADIRPLYQEDMQKRVYERLDETRRRKADACKQPGAKAASLAAGFLAQHALWDNGYADWKVCYGETGQPFVCRKGMTEQACPALAAGPASGAVSASAVGPATDAGMRDGRRSEAAPCISLSHSGDYAVCAVSDRPVGVDIQRIVPVRFGMLRRFFAKEEACAFQKRYELQKCKTGRARCTDPAAAGDERSAVFLPGEVAHEFLRLWTVKESCMKLVGTGLALGLSNVTADLERREAKVKLPAPEGENRAGEEKTCAIREQKAPEGYVLTACTGGAEDMLESLFWVDIDQQKIVEFQSYEPGLSGRKG